MDETMAQKKLIETYQAGLTVRFEKDYRRFGARGGDTAQVERVHTDAMVVTLLAIRRADGSTVRLARDRVLWLDYGHAVTGHGAQGLDASQVILEKDAHSRTTYRRSTRT
ncbi:MAG TPA: hypothetical protein VMT66_08580 [Steroidobacteraceae bacterium]|nr:hypothetical protein [Steroidobacteraceae bacterium]